MLIFLWFVLLLVVVSFLLLLPALWRWRLVAKYSGTRLVQCPENQRPAVVKIDAPYLAATEMDGRPNLRLCECTRWPERSHCAQECAGQALEVEPYPPGKAKIRTKQIYHLPIFVAAFVAWYLGMIWHSHYLFRARWMQAVGLTQAEIKQLVWWLSPHVLTAGACLLFAYGVAWLLAVSHRRGVLQGVLMSVLLCGGLVAVSSYAIAHVPHDLLMIECGYAILAALTVGAIVGGLYDKLHSRS